MSQEQKIKIFLLAAVLSVFIIPFLKLSFLHSLFLLLTFFLGLFSLLYPEKGIFLLIFLRPSVDYFNNVSFLQIGEMNLTPSYLIGLLSLIVGGIILYKHRQSLKSIPNIHLWTLFLFLLFISSIYSIVKSQTLIEAVRWLSIVFIYCGAFLIIKNRKDLIKLIKIIILSSVLPLVLAIYQYFTGQGLTVPLETVSNRLMGTFVHPNLFAYFLIIPIMLSLLIIVKKDWKNKIHIQPISLSILTLLLLFSLLLTFTRGAWLALFVGLLIVGVLKYRKILVVAGVVALFLYITISPIQTRINEIPNNYNTVQWRMDYWEKSINQVKQKPLLGYGAGMGKNIIRREKGYNQETEIAIHNDYIKIVLENGLLGFLSFIIIIIGFAFLVLREYFKKDNKHKDITLFILSIFVALSFAGLFDNIVRNTALQWSLWALVGGLLAISVSRKS